MRSSLSYIQLFTLSLVLSLSRPSFAEEPSQPEQFLISLTEQVLKSNPHYRCSKSPGEIPAMKGTLLALFGHMNGALKELKISRSLDPNLPYTHYTMACAYSLQNEEKEALASLERAIRLDPLYWKKAQLDKDFKNLSEHERFLTITSRQFLQSIDYSKSHATHCDDNYVFSLNIVKDILKDAERLLTVDWLAFDHASSRSFTEVAASESDKRFRFAPESSSYAKRLSQVLELVELPEDTFNFKVYLDPTANAYAFPDGSIRIHAGLMDVLADDMEFLAIVAHEIGHVMLRHGNQHSVAELLSKSWTERLVEEFSKHIIEVGDPTEPVDLERGISDINTTVQGRWSQALEGEADRFSAEFLNENGIDPNFTTRALLTFGDFLKELEDKKTSNEKPREFYIGTHLSAEERAKSLKAFIDESLR